MRDVCCALLHSDSYINFVTQQFCLSMGISLAWRKSFIIAGIVSWTQIAWQLTCV